MQWGLAYMRECFFSLIDAVWMPPARSERTRARTVGDILLTPRTHFLLGTRITTLASYHDQAITDMIQSLKYDGSAYATRLVAALLADYLREEIAEHKRFSARAVMLIALPLHPTRERERGFNQITRVLNALPHEFHDGTLSQIEHRVLKRVHYHTPQTTLSRAERIKNVRGAFVCSTPELVAGAHIFLIDDVATTGATLTHAARALTDAGATVSAIACARA